MEKKITGMENPEPRKSTTKTFLLNIYDRTKVDKKGSKKPKPSCDVVFLPRTLTTWLLPEELEAAN